MMEKTKNFTEGRILEPLIGFALPVSISFLVILAIVNSLGLLKTGAKRRRESEGSVLPNWGRSE